jgi:hypothetical protein
LDNNWHFAALQFYNPDFGFPTDRKTLSVSSCSKTNTSKNRAGISKAEIRTLDKLGIYLLFLPDNPFPLERVFSIIELPQLDERLEFDGRLCRPSNSIYSQYA